LLGLFFDPEDKSDMFLRNVLSFNGLQGVISQKTVLFILIMSGAAFQKCAECLLAAGLIMGPPGVPVPWSHAVASLRLHEAKTDRLAASFYAHIKF
jgi:hypothetical protein